MTALRDQTFAGGDGKPLTFDFIAPSSDQPLPLIVFLHGGGWISGDKTMYRDEAPFFVEHGYATACISYRLAPLHPFPAPVADVQRFLRHVREHAGELGIDPNRVAAFGNSAGGHLAAMAALAPAMDDGPDDGTCRAQAAVNICGISDLQDPRATHFPIAMAFLEQFVPSIQDPESTDAAMASPISHVSKGAAPMLILHGSEDDVVPFDQSVRLHQALRSASAKSRMVELPGEGHGFTFPAWQTIRKESLAFLSEALAG